MTYTYERAVNYYETDMMGVVHHSNYIRYFEEARIAFLEAIGLPYKRLEDNGIISPVLTINCDYKRMVQFGETVLIKVNLLEYNGIRMKVAYEVSDKATGKITTRGVSSHCFLTNSGKPVSLKKVMPFYNDKLLACLEEEKNRIIED